MMQRLGLQRRDSATPLLLEVWRRLCPEKPSLTLFCIELEDEIAKYEVNNHSPELPDLLAKLQFLLDEAVDTGLSRKKAFSQLQKTIKYDLESFLYHLIFDEIEAGEIDYAKELFEGFSPYIVEKRWFEFLGIKLEKENTGIRLEKLISTLKKEKNIELALEVLHFLAEKKMKTLFQKLALNLLPTLKRKDDFKEIALLTSFLYGKEIPAHQKNDDLKVQITSILKA
jgi:hypothetical protein